jgi:hypothetical protein
MPYTRFLLALAVPFAFAACSAPQPAPPIEVKHWGTMREVLREGRSEARVAPLGVTGPASIGVGALAGLLGEITVLDGRVLVAVPSPSGGAGEAPLACMLREAGAEDRAALLVLADVPAWEPHELRACASYDELEAAIARVLRRRGDELGHPIPVRVRGRATDLAFHVLAGACPIANPDGPPPWHWRGGCEDVQLVGFYAEGSAGELTHHGRRSHLHAVADGAMGHLDEVVLERAELLLPAR